MGGHLKKASLSGSGSPIGSVVPEYEGQLYLQGSPKILYGSTGLTSADWVRLIDSTLNPLAPQGDLDCSGNPNYLAASVGFFWVVSVAGKIGGASGDLVEKGDVILCLIANTGGTKAEVGVDFTILQGNLFNVVIGPDSATDGYIPLWDGASGKLLKNSTYDPANIPSTGEKAALAGTGTPSGSNKFVTADNAALTNARTPTAHNLVDGTNHPVTGLTTGNVLTATGATTYGFTAPYAAPAAKTSSYPLTVSDDFIAFTISNDADLTVTFPDAATMPGKKFTINRTNAPTAAWKKLIFAFYSAQTLNGIAGGCLIGQSTIMIQSDGANWQVVSWPKPIIVAITATMVVPDYVLEDIIFKVDATGAEVDITLPVLSTVVSSRSIGAKKIDASANAVKIIAATSPTPDDTIDDGTDINTTIRYGFKLAVASSTANVWMSC